MTAGNVIPAAYLLLLSQPPVCISYDSVCRRYKTTIGAVLKQLNAELKHYTIGCTLDIALPSHYLPQGFSTVRGSVYAGVQSLLAAFYKLICVVAAEGGINVEDAEGIDVRILLVEHTGNDSGFAGNNNHDGKDVQPLPGLETLARSNRPWNYIFSVDDAAGERILRTFLVDQERHHKIQKVPGSEDSYPGETLNTESDVNNRDHSGHQGHLSVALGGTFDHIHIGHKLLLTLSAFVLQFPASSEEEHKQCILTVGITGDELLKNKKHADMLQSWDDRQKSVSNFIQAIIDFRPPSEARVSVTMHHEPGPNGHAVHFRLTPNFVLRCVEIQDPFGPTITDSDITALVVSAETRAGGKAVNEKRMEKGWPTLEIFEVDVLDADADSHGVAHDDKFEHKLSSTRIRQALSAKARARNRL